MTSERFQLPGGFRLDLVRGCLMYAGECVHLRPLSYELLKYLVLHRGRLVSKDKLIEEVWQGRAVTDGALIKCVEEVRKALGSEGRHWVRNVRGRGYIFECDEVLDLGTLPGPDAGGVELPVVTAEVHHAPARMIPTRWRAGAVLALAVVTAAIVTFASVGDGRGRSGPPVSIAVLPFTTEAGGPMAEEVAGGIAQDLVALLSRVPHLKVTAAESSFQYKGAQVNLQEVAGTLGVSAVVTGRITPRADHLEVMVEVVNPRDSTHLWGGHYSVFGEGDRAAEYEIEQTIVDEVARRLIDNPAQSASAARATSLANQYYLSGVGQRRRGGAANVRRALEYFNLATEYEPHLSQAWTGAADAHVYLALHSMEEPGRELAEARTATERALEIDERLTEAHLELARISLYEWDFNEAEREFQRTLDLDPSLVEGHTGYATYLLCVGRSAEALAEIRRAEALDPLRAQLAVSEAHALFYSGRASEARHRLGQASALAPDEPTIHFALGFIDALSGRPERAIDEYQRLIALDGETTSRLCYLGYALAVSGDRTRAIAILDKLKTTTAYVSPAEEAILYAGLGDREGAFAALEKAYHARDVQLLFLDADRHYDSLKGDPRFTSLRRRIGLLSD